MRKPLGFKYFNYGVEEKNLDKVATEYFSGAPLFPPLSTFLAKAPGVPINEVIEFCNDPDREITVALLTSGNPILGNHMGEIIWIAGFYFEKLSLYLGVLFLYRKRELPG